MRLAFRKLEQRRFLLTKKRISAEKKICSRSYANTTLTCLVIPIFLTSIAPFDFNLTLSHPDNCAHIRAPLVAKHARVFTKC